MQFDEAHPISTNGSGNGNGHVTPTQPKKMTDITSTLEALQTEHGPQSGPDALSSLDAHLNDLGRRD